MKVMLDYTNELGSIKPMNAVNNGPVYTKNAGQNLGNLEDYRAANIPFARTHDASFCSSYGGEHTVDITAVFPDFDADPDLPENYDFHLTDEYIETIQLAGTQVFFRLGQKIEHGSKKYGIIPPKDFNKWACICEHIIAHMNEGWADGHHYGILYWEIWNEPDLDPDDLPIEKCKTWGGTREQFYDLYEITAKRLKARFPELKIGGPAISHGYIPKWTLPFLQRVKDRNIPLDFFSWHTYTSQVEKIVSNCRQIREWLDSFGLTETESNLNEWNYVTSFSGEMWRQSLKTEISLKGAAFISAVLSACQKEPLDMLMYYDARPCGMNGLFSLTFYEKLKGYYPIKAWGEMLKLGRECYSHTDIPCIYTASARGEGGSMSMLTYYTADDNAKPKSFKVEISGNVGDELNLFLLDGEHDMEEVETVYLDDGTFMLTMKPNSVVVLKEPVSMQ